MTNPDNVGGLPLLQFAVFDEFGKGADDRVWDYGRRCFEAGELCRAAPAGGDVPCDMGEMCLGCTPRNADGSCPDAAPAGSGEVDYDWDAAHEALESMDDYARMDKGVAPYGPYSVLRDLLTKAKGWKEEAALLRKLSTAGSGEVGLRHWSVELMTDLIDYAESGKVAEPSWIPRMQSLLRKLQQGADGWRPIESAPKDETRILLFNGAIWKGGWDLYAHRWSGAGAGHLVIAPSHWQPLPDAPASQGQEGGHG